MHIGLVNVDELRQVLLLIQRMDPGKTYYGMPIVDILQILDRLRSAEQEMKTQWQRMRQMEDDHIRRGRAAGFIPQAEMGDG
jgi:hypothetical protein